MRKGGSDAQAEVSHTSLTGIFYEPGITEFGEPGALLRFQAILENINSP